MMTPMQLRNELSSSLKMISMHVKYIRRYKRTQRQEREFLAAFEQNFLDSIYILVSATKVKTKEESALRHIKIVHYNSARVCLENVIRRMTPAWRRFKENKDLFVNISLSDMLFNQFVKQWNAAGDVVTKTRPYRDEDKIKEPGKFDSSIETLIEMEPHISETLAKCRLDRWWRVVVSCFKSIWILLVVPVAVLIVAAIVIAKLDIGKKDTGSTHKGNTSIENCDTVALTSSNNIRQVRHNGPVVKCP